MNYPQYPERMILDLNGFWDFQWLGDIDCDAIDPSDFVRQTAMAVPGVFDTLPGYDQQRGVGVYRKQLPDDFDIGETLRLSIGGMGLFGRIWFDGEHVADCQLPYSGVHYDFVVEEPGPHELVIAVDNRFDRERVPLFRPNYDFYGYGGIYRDVTLQQLPACAIDRVQVTPLDLETVRLTVKFVGDVSGEQTLVVSFDDGLPSFHVCEVENGVCVIEEEVPDPRVWSPSDPQLHMVEVAIDGDSVRERFGLRTIETKGQQILLNGEPIELRGFNRHEAHPELGPVQPPALMLEDAQWMQRMNCNFVRCVHYPQNEQFFDLCDELGILVWAESLGWGNTAGQLADETFMRLQEEQTRIMVRNGCNHPSIIVWAFLNEAESQKEEALPLYRALTSAIREEDPSRLVSYASNRRDQDLCFDLVDIISLNIYPGWIGPVDWETHSVEMIRPFTEDLIQAFCGDSPHADKPLIFSEIGACALYGCHDLAHSQWTEEYQADFMTEAARVILENPRTQGLTLWQFHDTRSYGAFGQVRSKPRGYNCAGVLDEYRRPKLATVAIGELYGSR
jgi:beta-glucuronidase